jgi:hypothetical protein
MENEETKTSHQVNVISAQSSVRKESTSTCVSGETTLAIIANIDDELMVEDNPMPEVGSIPEVEIVPENNLTSSDYGEERWSSPF